MNVILKGRQFLAVYALTIVSLLVLAVFVNADWTALSPVSIPIVESEHPYPNNFDDVWMVTNTDPNAEASRLPLTRIYHMTYRHK